MVHTTLKYALGIFHFSKIICFIWHHPPAQLHWLQGTVSMKSNKSCVCYNYFTWCVTFANYNSWTVGWHWQCCKVPFPPSLLYMDIFFFGGGWLYKTARTCCWTHIALRCQGWEWVELYLFFPSMPSWHEYRLLYLLWVKMLKSVCMCMCTYIHIILL